jgi:flavin reductase (DIM6/NTAB) family NADH-FMN oxidoreductase RutF
LCERCYPGNNAVKHIPYDQYLDKVNYRLSHSGVFLTSHKDKDNTMVMGWGGITWYWRRPIFIVPVRTTRYTWHAINETGVFTVSVPLNDELREAMAFCGSKSGRDYDKFKECNLTALPGKFVRVPVIGECNLHYECKVVFKQTMEPSLLDGGIRERHYKEHDFHTMFYGEIAACYLTE